MYQIRIIIYRLGYYLGYAMEQIDKICGDILIVMGKGVVLLFS